MPIPEALRQSCPGISAWQKLVALAPLLLLAICLPGQAMLRCRIGGQLRPTCCCPHDGEAQETGPVLKAQDCCDQVVSASQRPVVAAAQMSVVDPSRSWSPRP